MRRGRPFPSPKGWFIPAIFGAIALAGCGPSLVSGPGPSPVASAVVPPLPAGWAIRTTIDPNLEMGLPAGWQTVPDPNATTDPSSVASLAPLVQRQVSAANRLMAAGAFRLLASGSVPTLGAQGFVTLLVESGDPTLQAMADREAQLDATVEAATTPIDRTTLATNLGPAIREAYSGLSVTPYTEVDYLVRLPDGRSLTISIGADAAQAADPAPALGSIEAFAADVFATVAPAGTPYGPAAS